MDAEIGAFRVRFLRCPPPEISLVSRSKLSPVAIAVTVDGFGAKIKNRKRKMKKTRPSDGTSENGLKKKDFSSFVCRIYACVRVFFFEAKGKVSPVFVVHSLTVRRRKSMASSTWGRPLRPLKRRPSYWRFFGEIAAVLRVWRRWRS